jgi:hypothetical protein
MAEKQEVKMSNIPESIISRAQQMGYAVPYDYFVSMVNPTSQGSAWDWNNFVNLAVRMTNVTCYQSFSEKEWNKWEKEIRQIATSTAKIHAEQIVKDSGVLEWGGNKKESE